MSFPSTDFTSTYAEPFPDQHGYSTVSHSYPDSTFLPFYPYPDVLLNIDLDAYFDISNYVGDQDTTSAPSLPPSPSSTYVDSDASCPGTSVSDYGELSCSPVLSSSLPSSPSSSPIPCHAEVSIVSLGDDEDIDADGESDNGSDYDDDYEDNSDESFDPDEELRAVRNRKRIQQSRSARRDSISSSSSSTSSSVSRARQYKSKQSTRRGISLRKPAPRSNSSSAGSSGAFAIKVPTYRYCKPRCKQLSIEQYNAWLENPRTKKSRCPYCSYVQKRSPDLHRHIDSHFQKARGTAFVCCGIPVSELPKHNLSPSQFQLYDYQGSLWAGGCFQVLSRRDALQRHWDNRNVTCLRHTEMTQINLHEHGLV